MKHVRDYSHLSRAELISSILTHEVRPIAADLPTTTFKYEIIHEASGTRHPHSLRLLRVLDDAVRKKEHETLTDEEKEGISHGLEVTAYMIDTLKMIRRLEGKVDSEIPVDEKMPVDLTGTALIRALEKAQQQPPLEDQVRAAGVGFEEEDPADFWKQKERPLPAPTWARKQAMVEEESAKIANLEDIQLRLKELAKREGIRLIEPSGPGAAR